ncbi:NADH-quinone oxidoreductase subunit M [Halodesulfurarchaeum formicicum]|uniref:NADH-quinone oxidoreductase subunit M n=1 Tax=Halodesulfurarchaeum formicicum TaxID=1873524 RepID=A0A1D8S4S6_9EURY|nr:NuoM family protein [Halodesulfurarchaeum formicicum]AOW80352.1 NADH-quinone oxidoreductase subunit M [Halodesulfurarchaeum formicicum]APE95655.1 NADH-quinone oxidoreductase subunit M [Halodesulfurarchaeum formicicum]
MMIEALILVTVASAVAVMFADDERAGRLAFGLSLLPLVGSLLMFLGFDGSGNALLGGEIAYETQLSWITLGDLEVGYHVGVDGIGLSLVVLTTVLMSLALLSAWTPIDERQSQFYGLMLFMEASLLGVFTALDFLAWFVAWEFVLVPMYFLIGIWGGPRRKYAAIKFFVYTNVASLVMFIGFVALVFGLPVNTFDLPTIAQSLQAGELGSLAGIAPETLKAVAFVAIFAGFAVKVPMVPFHTWLPDAHVEAPTPVSVILAGVLLKMGTYAMLRFNFTMLSDQAQAFAVPIAIFAVVSVIYGAMLALGQQDLKRIVAYSSVSSMGYVLLGLVAYNLYGLGGATFQMVAHGLISGLMFMSVGVVYNVAHTRMVGDLSGIADRMPLTATVFTAAAFGYMGLPLMAGFAGELYIFLGGMQSTALPYAPIFTALAMFGIVIVAGYLLFAMQRVLFGPFEADTDHEIVPAPVTDRIAIVALVLLVILLGTAPDLIYGMIQDAVQPILTIGGGL